ncbi:MAG: gamma-glutamyltransferase [bacterium]|nr:gamma-glutamyltransferase [bacterium]
MTRGVIATPHRLASEVGGEILRQGGNAFDAAVAADAVLCVVYPHMTSIGGDLFALVWPAGADGPVGLAGAGRAGSRAGIDAVREQGWTQMPERGPCTVTVPGTVEAWGRLVERFGSLGLGALLAPAAGLARDGWAVAPGVASALAVNADWLAQEEEAWRLWPSLKAGMTLRNPDLAAVLDEIGKHGFHDFYRGQIAAAMAETLERRGGFVTREDLARHRSEWVDPIAFRYRDLTVYELPPPTQGLAAAGLLRRFERCSSNELRGPGFADVLVEARDQVYPLRDRLISDPDFAAVPVEPFLDPSMDGAAPVDRLPEGDTVYLCAADGHGNLVSLIQSVSGSFGSGVVATGTGILLHNRGAYFKLDPGHVNRLEPGKRTMHTLIPALAARGGRPCYVFGTMGGDGQPQIQSQVLMGLADHGEDPQEAVARPRLRVPADGVLWVEADHPHASEILRSRAGAVPMAPADLGFGHAHAIAIDGPSAWRAGADPRSDGGVVTV